MRCLLDFINSINVDVDVDANSCQNNSNSTKNNFCLREAGTKVGPEQLGPPVRVGSTRIDSDDEKTLN